MRIHDILVSDRIMSAVAAVGIGLICCFFAVCAVLFFGVGSAAVPDGFNDLVVSEIYHYDSESSGFDWLSLGSYYLSPDENSAWLSSYCLVYVKLPSSYVSYSNSIRLNGTLILTYYHYNDNSVYHRYINYRNSDSLSPSSSAPTSGIFATSGWFEATYQGSYSSKALPLGSRNLADFNNYVLNNIPDFSFFVRSQNNNQFGILCGVTGVNMTVYAPELGGDIAINVYGNDERSAYYVDLTGSDNNGQYNAELRKTKKIFGIFPFTDVISGINIPSGYVHQGLVSSGGIFGLFGLNDTYTYNLNIIDNLATAGGAIVKSVYWDQYTTANTPQPGDPEATPTPTPGPTAAVVPSVLPTAATELFKPVSPEVEPQKVPTLAPVQPLVIPTLAAVNYTGNNITAPMFQSYSTFIDSSLGNVVDSVTSFSLQVYSVGDQVTGYVSQLSNYANQVSNPVNSLMGSVFRFIPGFVWIFMGIFAAIGLLIVILRVITYGFNEGFWSLFGGGR